MADDTVQIRFGAETSGVTAGATEIKTQLAALRAAVSDLAAGLKTLAGTAVAGSADSAAAQIKGFDELAQAQQRQVSKAVATAKSSTDTQLAATKQLYDLGQLSAQSYFSRVQALHQQDTSALVAALRQQLDRKSVV